MGLASSKDRVYSEAWIVMYVVQIVTTAVISLKWIPIVLDYLFL